MRLSRQRPLVLVVDDFQWIDCHFRGVPGDPGQRGRGRAHPVADDLSPRERDAGAGSLPRVPTSRCRASRPGPASPSCVTLHRRIRFPWRSPRLLSRGPRRKSLLPGRTELERRGARIRQRVVPRHGRRRVASPDRPSPPTDRGPSQTSALIGRDAPLAEEHRRRQRRAELLRCRAPRFNAKGAGPFSTRLRKFLQADDVPFGSQPPGSLISVSAWSSHKRLPISRNIVAAVMRCSCACSRLPIRRETVPRPR